MLGKVPASRLRLIERIVRVARRSLPARDRTLAEAVLRRYFRGVADEDLVARGVEPLAAAALAHFSSARTRRAGRSFVRVFNPDPAIDGFRSPHTVVMICCDDMPFLVDSMSMAANQAGLAVHLIVHPVIDVRRDRRGRLLEIVEPDTTGRAESWQMLEIDREADPARLEALATRLEAALDDVRVAVGDWAEMRRRATDLATSLETQPLPMASSEVVETRALLEWMADNHFTFLGYRYYRLERGRSSDRLLPQSATGLGLLRAKRPRHPAPLPLRRHRNQLQLGLWPHHRRHRKPRLPLVIGHQRHPVGIRLQHTPPHRPAPLRSTLQPSAQRNRPIQIRRLHRPHQNHRAACFATRSAASATCVFASAPRK